MPDDEQLAGIRLDQISTHLATLQDAQRFVMRYGKAIQTYLTAVVRDPDDAKDVFQDLVAGLLGRGGPTTWPGLAAPTASRGRFRDYLKVIARNAALSFFRKKNRRHATDIAPDDHADPTSTDDAADRAMTAEWQRCVLEKVWRELETHERQSPGNLFHTALRVYTEFPNDDSVKQAATVSAKLNRTVSPEAFRKQVSRGKRLMAELILREVAATVDDASADDVEAELTELGLMKYVRDYLPDDWREQFFGR
jgi:DNA-directed RNA polymerase specialized sigma24 family protein